MTTPMIIPLREKDLLLWAESGITMYPMKKDLYIRTESE